jgi:hypothetical protein
MNVIVSGFSLLLFACCYFPPNFRELNSTKTRMQEFLELDFGGFFLYAAGLILLLLGFCKTLTFDISYSSTYSLPYSLDRRFVFLEFSSRLDYINSRTHNINCIFLLW